MTISFDQSIIYVESPLQILSALEYCNEYNENPIFIVNFGNKKRIKNREQMLNLLEPIPANRKLVYKHFRNSLISDIYSFFFMIKMRRMPISKRFIIGDFRSKVACNFFLANRAKERVYMDDGAATIVTQLDYIQKGIYAPKLRSKRQKVFQRFYDFVFNFKYSELKCPNLYSFFAGEGLLRLGQKNLRKPKPLIRKEKLNNTCFFFGSKYSESRIMLLEDEIESLRQISEYYQHKNIDFFYIPHRDESKEKLSIIRDLNIKIKDLGVPAETYFSSTKSIPSHIAACWSTVIYSIGKAYELESVISFDILSKMKKEGATRERAKTVYQFYQQSGIDIIKI
ncbi:hypothetical protein BCT11_12775 [Vibrio sp. 10N.222.52.B12]|uniref:polysialyltransferase family glycosyltransferase n=1 Tax=Vibrio sp. 10N.222.52.B12 TaxID=1880840 RepID=UPI000C828A8C|nr:polysialyltransferase family glycosyltransferase [Vibrio sp. 10N.222.52.B12]PMO41110.1 hypothetical protein BCT11_12775 [Vibrio sp. 10N.222.52.B12]